MRKWQFVLALGLLGLLVGSVAFHLSGTGNYCSEVEAGIRSNATFNGSIACYPPGVVNVNVSEKVERSSDVRCVCIKSFRGRESIFTVTFSD